VAPQAWSELLGRTWLKDAGLVGDLDGLVKTQLAGHRSLPKSQYPSVAPASVSVLVTDIEFLGSNQKWFWATAAICLLTELIVAAESGGVFKAGKAKLSERNHVLANDLEALEILRNAIFHPAHQSSKAGAGHQPHIATLIEYLNDNNEGSLAAQLEPSWSKLGTRPFTEFALRKLNSAGRNYAGLMKLTSAETRTRHR
jgi:hypothetical protein